MPRWQPIHENHAIDVMAAVVTFAQPLPDRLLSAVFKVSEEAAFSVGLKSRHSSSGIQFTVGPTGIVPSPSAPQGLLFNALFETEAGEPIPGKIAEQLQIDSMSVIYRTWRYVSWSWQTERMKSLMSPALRVVASAVAMNKMRLEYLDRFKFDGPAADARASGLLQIGSPYVSPAIFDAESHWHSHMGTFLAEAGGQSKRLQQVNVDALDQPDLAAPEMPIRWVNITTAREDRYVEAGVADHEINADIVFGDFDRLHAELKVLLAEVITADLAAKIYLTDQKQ
ncbi:MAG: hypothetical protein ACR2K5_06675 [Pseudolabrys sp.]